jgi:uncharacterized protein YdhG (YjbR/CyaY superfamily)
VSPRRKYRTVREYLADVPPEPRRRLNAIRRLVRQRVPGALETISYNIPAFRLHRVFMYCAAFKGHVAIFPPLRKDSALVRRLKPYRNAKGNLRFGLDEPLPLALVGRIAKALALQSSPPARRRGRA